jgi:hypothetical protein
MPATNNTPEKLKVLPPDQTFRAMAANERRRRQRPYFIRRATRPGSSFAAGKNPALK